MNDPGSSCSYGESVGLQHEEIDRNLPTCIDILDHLQGKEAAPSQGLGRAPTRAENVCKLRAGLGHWGICSTRAGSARDSIVSARCRLGSTVAMPAPKRAR